MATRGTRLVVNHAQVTEFIMPGGEVSDEVDKIARNAHRIAQSVVPVRTNTLRNSLRWNKAKPESPDRTASRFIASAAHAFYVNDGTSRIYAKGKDGFLLVPHRGGPDSFKGVGGGRQAYNKWVSAGKKGRKGFTRRDSVAGQAGAHFMEESLHRAMNTFKAGG